MRRLLAAPILLLLVVEVCAGDAFVAPGPAALVDINAESGEGRLFKGATVPFGMLMWGPNTAAGYSLTCLSGAEMNGEFYDFVAVRPTIRTVADVASRRDYGGAVSRAITGEPGYCRTKTPDDVRAELTAATRAGLGRFTPPAGKPLSVLINATEIRLDAAHQRLLGQHQIESRGGSYTVYFAVEFDRAFDRCGVIRNGQPTVATSPADQSSISAGYVTFGALPAGQSVQLRLGMSYVSRENALANLQAEIPGWSFEEVRTKARQSWNEALSAIEVTGGPEVQRRLFYTCLYRVWLQPNTFSDGNGQYLGFDGQIHVARQRRQFANYSIWDTYRTWVELVAWLRPREAGEMMQSLVADAQAGGGAMPRWPVANRETGTMEEGSATPLVCSAYAFGATNFDVPSAFAIMDRTESVPGVRCQDTEAHEGLADFLARGYVPQGGGNLARSASFTLEYATAAFTLAQLAHALGQTNRYEFYLKQACNWTNLYHAPSGYLHARKRDGSWLIEAHNPAGGAGFTEGNAAQFTWTVRHDLGVVVARVGGKAAATERLDALCRQLNAGPRQPFLWIGNEPSFSIPWAYDWIGRPDRTDAIVHAILTEEWHEGTTPGADDLGAMSAWYVWAALGLYPAIPGVAGWTINSPLFDSVTIHQADGGVLHLVARRSGPGDIFVQRVTLDGQPWVSTWLPKSVFGGAGQRLEWVLGSAPGRDWGTQPQDAPPSFP